MSGKVNNAVKMLVIFALRFPILVIWFYWRQRGVKFAHDFEFFLSTHLTYLHGRLKLPNFIAPRGLNDVIRKQIHCAGGAAFTKISDKVSARDFVAQSIGNEYLVPLIGIYESIEDIPKEFKAPVVLKASHDSGSVLFFPRGIQLNESIKVTKHFSAVLGSQYGRSSGEWWYAGINPRIIIEEMLIDADGHIPSDWKLHYYHGHVWVGQHISGRYSTLQESIFNYELEDLPVLLDQRMSRKTTPKINKNLFREMVRLGKALSEGFEYLRVDFYLVGSRIFFGEMTLAPMGGMYRGIGEIELLRFAPSIE